MRKLSFGGFLLLSAGLAFADKPATESAAATAFKALSAEYDGKYKETRATYKAEKNDDKIDDGARTYRARVHEFETEYAPKFLAIAEKYPKDRAAVDALVRAGQLGAGDSPASEKALTILLKEHIADSRISQVINDLAYTKWTGADNFLHTVLEKSPSRDARGLAAYWEAYRLGEKANDELGTPAGERASRDAEALLQAVIAKYADVPSGRPNATLGQRAAIALAELQRLAIGKVAPDIEGADGDGKHFKLSDYRGKVVVLDFWGHWCPDCRGVYPRQRELVKQFEGKPFVLLGINSDENKDELKKVLAKRGVHWRYWFDGGMRGGPIASAWNIQSWPTIYILDAKGVIRHRGHEELADKLDQLVSQLLKEADGRVSAK
jgi:thiol-disulfide isomerase/thioredoxin